MSLYHLDSWRLGTGNVCIYSALSYLAILLFSTLVRVLYEHEDFLVAEIKYHTSRGSSSMKTLGQPGSGLQCLVEDGFQPGSG